MHDNNMKDLLRDYVSSKIYSGTMFHQRLLRDSVSKIHPGTICFVKDPLRDHVSSEIYSGTMFHQRSTQGLCFIKDPLRDSVSSEIHSGTMFHQRSTLGLCFIRDLLRDYVSSNIHSGTMFHQSVLNGQDHRWSLIIRRAAHSWHYCVHGIWDTQDNLKSRHA